jgi:hypothetical protein
MSAALFALRFVKLALLDQLGAQLGLPPHADRAPAVLALMTVMPGAALQAVWDLGAGWRGLSDIPARSWSAGS